MPFSFEHKIRSFVFVVIQSNFSIRKPNLVIFYMESYCSLTFPIRFLNMDTQVLTVHDLKRLVIPFKSPMPSVCCGGVALLAVCERWQETLWLNKDSVSSAVEEIWLIPSFLDISYPWDIPDNWRSVPRCNLHTWLVMQYPWYMSGRDDLPQV